MNDPVEDHHIGKAKDDVDASVEAAVNEAVEKLASGTESEVETAEKVAETALGAGDGIDHMQQASTILSSTGEKVMPKKRRLCRYPGCTKVIKSQGHCQRHGARAKRCKVEGCDKQAQGTHDGMCKRHWKQVHFPPAPPKTEDQAPPPEGESVYDSILPLSISYRPQTILKRKDFFDDATKDPLDPPPAPEGVTVMPLIHFLRENHTKDAGWHRNEERRARGMYEVDNLASQLEPWERQLALVEILLLSGGTPYANFKDLAHAWGREKGFHHLLAGNVCERRGEVERKRRSDAGRHMSMDERNAFRAKLKKTRIEREEAAAAAVGVSMDEAMLKPAAVMCEPCDPVVNDAGAPGMSDADLAEV